MLIDTHIVLWASAEPERLSAQQRAVLEDPAVDLLISAVSAVEIEIKRGIGKLSMPHSVDDLRRSLDAEWLDLTGAHAMALRTLPNLHRDPFDRMLIAQAITDEIPLMTNDRRIHDYEATGLLIPATHN